MNDLNTLKQDLLRPFQSAEVRIKNVPAKPGKTAPPPLPYVSARVVMNRLDEVLPFSWSFTLGPSRIDGGNLTQYGTLTLHVDGRELRYEDVGIAPPDGGAAQAKQAKQAVSDCLKRCAIHAGVGRYLYELQGVRANGILQPSLEKAVRAVGWTGTIEKHHWGTIGGVRELDAEDEDADPGPPLSVVNGGQANAQAPVNGNGSPVGSLDHEQATWATTLKACGIKDAAGLNAALRAIGFTKNPKTAQELFDANALLREKYLPARDGIEDPDAGYEASVAKDGPAPTLLPPTEGIDPRAAQQAMSVTAIKG